MGDTVNIHNILQAGYFNRSRSKSPAHVNLDYSQHHHRRRQSGRALDDTPRQYHPSRADEPPNRLPLPSKYQSSAYPRPRTPPPPTVDDEESILAKEHGYSRTVVPEEEPSSRGHVDQNPVMMEVHEFNPERRFVIFDDDPALASASDNNTFNDYRSTSPSKSPDTPENLTPSDDSSRTRRRPPSPGPSPSPANQRRSRPDLSALDTDSAQHRHTQHHRSRSAANVPRPDYFTASRSPRPYAQHHLSPVPTRQRSRGRQEIYRGGEYKDRSWERKCSRHPPGDSPKRSDTATEPRSRRTESIDRDSRRRHQDYHLREESSTRANQFSTREMPRSSDRVSREYSQSMTGYPKTSHSSSSSSTPTAAQQAREPIIPTSSDISRAYELENSKLKSTPSRVQTTPLSSVSDHAVEKPPVLRPVATSNVAKGSDNPPPYPEEDLPQLSSSSIPLQENQHFDDLAEPIYMPDIPSEPTQSTQYKTVGQTTSQSQVSMPDPKEWKLSTFDPEKDGSKPERPVGSYRRYSENRNNPSSEQLPSCPRMKPVTGKADWLTLPRTDFNICPDCYGQVFSNSDYRTHFYPVLRPTMDAISCDFGSSPWYRIAWLLILKDRDTDLKVFHDISAISSAARGHECPGDRKTTRDWYTIEDPFTKRPVPEFTVCHQCANTVEALLPSLSGIFVPLNTRSARSTCSLRFAPDRTDFVLYFDSFETTADKAEKSRKGPDLGYLAQKLERLSIYNACREDRPVADEYWHFMQFLPEFTVCADCFGEVVRPRLTDEGVIARNFYIRPQKVTRATCQLYSLRMRDVFRRACRRNDPKYLEVKVRERLAIESSIKNKLAKLDREGSRDPRSEKQRNLLIEEWREWE